MSFPGEGFLSGLVGGAFNYYGAKRANEANKKMAREQMAFQQASNREQMDFQERMSNTAYQRSMEDMKKAGINPILAFGQGGANTPGGSSSAGSTASIQNEFAGAVSSALQSRMISAQIAQTKATTDIIKSELPGKKAEAELYQSKAGKLLKVLQLVNPTAQTIMRAIGR